MTIIYLQFSVPDKYCFDITGNDPAICPEFENESGVGRCNLLRRDLKTDNKGRYCKSCIHLESPDFGFGYKKLK